LFVVVVVAVVVADDEEDSEREMKYLSFSDFVMDGVDGELLVEAFVLTVLNEGKLVINISAFHMVLLLCTKE